MFKVYNLISLKNVYTHETITAIKLMNIVSPPQKVFCSSLQSFSLLLLCLFSLFTHNHLIDIFGQDFYINGITHQLLFFLWILPARINLLNFIKFTLSIADGIPLYGYATVYPFTWRWLFELFLGFECYR